MRWLALIPLLAWLYLLVAHGRFWRTDVRLGDAPEPPLWPPVAVIVPARNEAASLPGTLTGLVAQDYPGPAQVIVVDDRSTDGTGEVARALGGNGRLPLEVLSGTETPAGWAGKLWALEQGVRSVLGARAAAGGTGWEGGSRAAADPFPEPRYLLFTDADISHPSDSLRRLVSWAEATGADVVSLMARLRASDGWERLLIPAFVYFFAQLYPFRRVNRPRARTAAAAGGCVLMSGEALVRAGGLEAVRGAVIDDVALAGAVKRSGGRLWLGLADDVISVRPYSRLSEAWDMVARSAFNQLRYSTPLLAATLAGLAVIFLGPLAALAAGLATGDWLAAGAGGLAWAAMVGTYLPMVRYYGLGWWWALTLPATACLYAAMTVSSAWRHWHGGVSWKGRSL